MLGDIIGAGAKLIGGLLGHKAGKDAISAKKQMNAKNIQMQKEFAQQGIRWKVDDAKAAGIHPLYALGANTHSFSPVDVGFSANNSLGNAISDMGQDIGRAVDATRTRKEREEALERQSAFANLQLENASLQNDLLRSQIAKNRAAPNPPMPSSSSSGIDGLIIDGQGDSRPTVDFNRLFQPQPNRPIVTQPARPHQEVGHVPDISYTKTPNGYAIAQSVNAKERNEENLGLSLAWSLRNQLVPVFNSKNHAPPRSWLPKGYNNWLFRPLTNEFVPTDYVPPSGGGAW